MNELYNGVGDTRMTLGRLISTVTPAESKSEHKSVTSYGNNNDNWQPREEISDGVIIVKGEELKGGKKKRN